MLSVSYCFLPIVNVIYIIPFILLMQFFTANKVWKKRWGGNLDFRRGSAIHAVKFFSRVKIQRIFTLFGWLLWKSRWIFQVVICFSMLCIFTQKLMGSKSAYRLFLWSTKEELLSLTAELITVQNTEIIIQDMIILWVRAIMTPTIKSDRISNLKMLTIMM